MRIVRSDDEQIVSTHARHLYGHNNLYYNQQQKNNCAYDTDIDFSYSGKQFANELARDREYGTSNIRPSSNDINSFSKRMYQDAIEEASRVKTMGYFNDLPPVSQNSTFHDNVPGRLKEKATSNTNVVSFSNFSPSNNHSNLANNNIPPVNNIMMPKPDEVYSEMNNSYVNSNNDINKNNTNFNIDSNKTPNKYDELIDQVRADVKHDINTQRVEEGRIKLREKVKVENSNNIPYLVTKKFTSRENKLQVRDCKTEKSMENKSQKSNFISFILLFPLLICPIIGFITSIVVCFISPKNKALKNFAYFCLTVHMILSLVTIYLYFEGYITKELISKYIDLSTIKKYIDLSSIAKYIKL